MNVELGSVNSKTLCQRARDRVEDNGFQWHVALTFFCITDLKSRPMGR